MSLLNRLADIRFLKNNLCSAPGDFPALFSNKGYARLSFLTNLFKSKYIIGKSVMIHQNPDDYRSKLS
ncbi:hypothetical protein F3157_15110 [Virgibacillus dakarensis]|nr:superoxide dismutase family protein [Virgibacillus dakarensis]MTW86977.1 hypothetical protein [Virgibacillus dakarensis]